MRHYLVTILSKEHRVIQAADGETGLRLIKKHNPDLVLLDIMLPALFMK